MNQSLKLAWYITLIVLGSILGLALLWQVREIVVMLLLAIVLSSAMEPLITYLHRWRIPRGVSVFGLYVVVLGGVAAIASLMLPVVVEQFQKFVVNLPGYIAAITYRYPLVAPALQNIDASAIVQTVLGAQGGVVIAQAWGVFGSVFTILTVLVVAFYISATDRGLKKFIADFLPEAHQEFAIQLADKVQRKMGLWVFGQMILSLFIFTLTFLGLTALGIDYALFLALLAGLLEVVPYAGPAASALPAILFAGLQSPPLAIAVVILYVVIQKIEGSFLVPKVMQATVGTQPLVVILSLLIGFKVAGVPGLLLAVPLASAAQVIIRELSSHRRSHHEAV